jgi:hypothetical protein
LDVERGRAGKRSSSNIIFYESACCSHKQTREKPQPPGLAILLLPPLSSLLPWLADGRNLVGVNIDEDLSLPHSIVDGAG